MNHPQSTSESRVQFSEIVIIGSRWFIVELARTLEHIVKSDRFWQSRSMSDACEPRAYARNPHLLAAHTLCWPKKTVHVPPARHEIVPARAHAAPIGHVTTSCPWCRPFPDLLHSSLSYTRSLIRSCTSLAAKPAHVDRHTVERMMCLTPAPKIAAQLGEICALHLHEQPAYNRLSA